MKKLTRYAPSKKLVMFLAGTVCATAWAAKVGVSPSPTSIETVLPAAQRPFAASEIYRQADKTQTVPEIRAVRAELAYRPSGRSGPTSAQQVCLGWQTALQRAFGLGAASVRCHPGLGWGPKEQGDDTVMASATVNYPQSPKPIAENLSVVIVVCKPGQEYDGGKHVCYWPDGQSDSGN